MYKNQFTEGTFSLYFYYPTYFTNKNSMPSYYKKSFINHYYSNKPNEQIIIVDFHSKESFPIYLKVSKITIL